MSIRFDVVCLQLQPGGVGVWPLAVDRGRNKATPSAGSGGRGVERSGGSSTSSSGVIPLSFMSETPLSALAPLNNDRPVRAPVSAFCYATVAVVVVGGCGGGVVAAGTVVVIVDVAVAAGTNVVVVTIILLLLLLLLLDGVVAALAVVTVCFILPLLILELLLLELLPLLLYSCYSTLCCFNSASVVLRCTAVQPCDAVFVRHDIPPPPRTHLNVRMS